MDLLRYMDKKIQNIWDEISSKMNTLSSNLKNLLNKKNDNVLIITHGDLDGVGALVQMYLYLKTINNRATIDFLFTMPINLFSHTHLNPYNLVIIVDVAIDNRDTNKALSFFKIDVPMIYIDHHYYPKRLKSFSAPDKCLIMDNTYKSCVSLIDDLLDIKYNKKQKDLITFAHKTDQGDGNNIFSKALKKNFQSEETRMQIFFYAISKIGGEMETQCLKTIEEKASDYEEINENTVWIYENYRKVYKNVSFIDMRETQDKRADKTRLSFMCYKESEICIIKFLSKKKDEYIRITIRPKSKLNLLNVFSLKSGARFRVTIKNETSVAEEEKWIKKIFSKNLSAKTKRSKLKGYNLIVKNSHFSFSRKYFDCELINKLNTAL